MWGAGGKISHARSKQYEANARWHCASEAEASGKYGERQSQLGLCVTAAKVAAADLKEIKDLSDTACQPINSCLPRRMRRIGLQCATMRRYTMRRRQ